MDAELLSETFVELTDTMVAGFDVIDFPRAFVDGTEPLTAPGPDRARPPRPATRPRP
jgi:hypothetical protein